MPNPIKVIEGKPEPLGISFQDNLANFAVFSSAAKQVHLGIFSQNSLLKGLPMQRTGDVWHLALRDLPSGLHYAYSCDNGASWLVDPYAKQVESLKVPTDPLHCFDWKDDVKPQIPLSDLIIYEMHVRGFTKDPSSKTAHPGTYLAVIEKIPFLKKLGVTAVELMPIFESDPAHNRNIDPETKERLPNYWGYNPCHYFAPRSWYAVHHPVNEFKLMVQALHKAGIEVILDVVYNHTGEEGVEHWPPINFRGLDNKVYYMSDDSGKYLDFTGCHNTFNCNHPVVQKLILDSLRYWVQEMHVDGFRFDLCSVLTRDSKGHPLNPSPLIEAIGKDPILQSVKLISESWDAAGLYQVGAFPQWGPWSEWNGYYRDTVRRFLKGGDGLAGAFADVLTGTNSIYKKTPFSSINFITAHDGFGLRDLVSYQQKHNYANGEKNQDGCNHNDSWNCGHEGATDNLDILALRERQMRNFLLALLLSQGVPMLYMTDVYGHTANGNNNPFVQDNRLSWFLWDEFAKNQKIFHFISRLISFRKNHKALTSSTFLSQEDIDWHASVPFHPDWSAASRMVSCTYKKGQRIYLNFNASSHPVSVELPPGNWHLCVNTSEDWLFHERGPVLKSSMELAPYSAILAIE